MFSLVIFDLDFEQSLRFFNNQQSKMKNLDCLCILISPNDFFVWPYIFGCVSFHPIWAYIPKNVVKYQTDQCLIWWYPNPNPNPNPTVRTEKFWLSSYIALSKLLLHLTISFCLCFPSFYMSLITKDGCQTSKGYMFIMVVCYVDLEYSR